MKKEMYVTTRGLYEKMMSQKLEDLLENSDVVEQRTVTRLTFCVCVCVCVCVRVCVCVCVLR